MDATEFRRRLALAVIGALLVVGLGWVVASARHTLMLLFG